MAEHLTDDDLVGHFYGDGSPADEARVDAHLVGCDTCRGHWEETVAALKMLDRAAVPEPDAGFEARMWQRLQPALGTPDAAELETTWTRRSRSYFGLGVAAGLAAAVAVGVVTTHSWESRPATSQAEIQPAATAAVDSNGRERVLLTALDDHFERSEMLLVEFLNAPASPGPELAFERATADDLLDSNRLYRVAASQNGNFRFADMLEDLESVLVEIARSPDQMDRGDLRSIRSRIQDDNLLFKVRAVSQQIEERRKDLSTQ
jgi:hypothetical protein